MAVACSYRFVRELDKVNGEMPKLACQDRCRQNVSLLGTIKPKVLLGYPNRNPEPGDFVWLKWRLLGAPGAGNHEEIRCRQLWGETWVVSYDVQVPALHKDVERSLGVAAQTLACADESMDQALSAAERWALPAG